MCNPEQQSYKDGEYGMVKTKIVPFSGTEATLIVPPISSTYALHIESPSPVPPNCRDTFLSTW